MSGRGDGHLAATAVETETEELFAMTEKSRFLERLDIVRGCLPLFPALPHLMQDAIAARHEGSDYAGACNWMRE